MCPYPGKWFYSGLPNSSWSLQLPFLQLVRILFRAVVDGLGHSWCLLFLRLPLVYLIHLWQQTEGRLTKAERLSEDGKCHTGVIDWNIYNCKQWLRYQSTHSQLSLTFVIVSIVAVGCLLLILQVEDVGSTELIATAGSWYLYRCSWRSNLGKCQFLYPHSSVLATMTGGIPHAKIFLGWQQYNLGPDNDDDDDDCIDDGYEKPNFRFPYFVGQQMSVSVNLWINYSNLVYVYS